MERNKSLFILAGLIVLFLVMRNKTKSGSNMDGNTDQPSSPDLPIEKELNPISVSDPKRFNDRPILVTDPVITTKPKQQEIEREKYSSSAGIGFENVIME